MTYSFQLIALGHSIGGNHAIPLLAPLLRVNVEDVRCDESRRDTIDPTEVHPLDRQALGELHDTSFRGIVLDESVI